MSSKIKFTHCVGNSAFKPKDLIKDTERQEQAQSFLAKDDLYSASRVLLGLPEPDTYTYHAMTSVTLAQVQHIVNLGGVNGLHAWYRQEDGASVRGAVIRSVALGTKNITERPATET